MGQRGLGGEGAGLVGRGARARGSRRGRGALLSALRSGGPRVLRLVLFLFSF